MVIFPQNYFYDIWFSLTVRPLQIKTFFTYPSEKGYIKTWSICICKLKGKNLYNQSIVISTLCPVVLCNKQVTIHRSKQNKYEDGYSVIFSYNLFFKSAGFFFHFFSRNTMPTNIYNCNFAAKHAALRRKSKDGLTWN